MSIESTAELYALMFPNPLLEKEEVAALLRNKVGGISGGGGGSRASKHGGAGGGEATLESIQWERVALKQH